MSDLFNISRIAHLARLKLTEKEAEEFTPQLETILSYIDTLSELDVDKIEPSAHASPVYAIPRADIIGKSLSVNDLEQNAPSFSLEQVKVPRVVES